MKGGVSGRPLSMWFRVSGLLFGAVRASLVRNESEVIMGTLFGKLVRQNFRDILIEKDPLNRGKISYRGYRYGLERTL